MGLTRSERETIIRWDEDEKRVQIYTASPVTKRRLEKKGWSGSAVTAQSGAETGWEFEAPEGAVTFRRLQNGAIAKRKPSGSAFQKKSEIPDPRDVAILGGDPSL